MVIRMNKKVINSIQYYIIGLFVFLMIVYLCSGFTAIEQNEIGIRKSFGKVTNKKVIPGIHYRLPYPFGEIIKIPDKVIHRIFIDDFSSDISDNVNAYAFYDLTGLSTYLITADNNILNLEVNIQYRISNPYNYYYSMQTNENFLRELASSIIIKSISMMSIDTALTTGKRDIERFIKENIQKKLLKLDAGINIMIVELLNVTPPSRVQAYFDDVINASIEINRLINDAQSYRTQQLSSAQIEYNRRTTDAEIYKNEIINTSIGDKERFLNILSAYEQNPELEKSRLFIEFVKNTFSNIEQKIFIHKQSGKSAAHIRLLTE